MKGIKQFKVGDEIMCTFSGSRLYKAFDVFTIVKLPSKKHMDEKCFLSKGGTRCTGFNSEFVLKKAPPPPDILAEWM